MLGSILDPIVACVTQPDPDEQIPVARIWEPKQPDPVDEDEEQSWVGYDTDGEFDSGRDSNYNHVAFVSELTLNWPSLAVFVQHNVDELECPPLGTLRGANLVEFHDPDEIYHEDIFGRKRSDMMRTHKKLLQARCQWTAIFIAEIFAWRAMLGLPIDEVDEEPMYQPWFHIQDPITGGIYNKSNKSTRNSHRREFMDELISKLSKRDALTKAGFDVAESTQIKGRSAELDFLQLGAGKKVFSLLPSVRR